MKKTEIIMLIIAAVFGLALGWVQVKIKNDAPCRVFSGYSLNTMPVRCVEYYKNGGITWEK